VPTLTKPQEPITKKEDIASLEKEIAAKTAQNTAELKEKEAVEKKFINLMEDLDI